MTKTIDVFTLAELKESHPDAFARVHAKWSGMVARVDSSWSEETMKSFRAVVDACGGTLADWSIGAWNPCSATVEGIDDEDEGEESPRDMAWFRANVLDKYGYVLAKPTDVVRKWQPSTDPANRIDFPGLCPFTGYCADEDFIEHVWARLCAGDSLTDALESCASVAGQHMEDDIEQMQDEESMLANWGERLYTRDGIKV